jgi:hypothetical protein
MGRPITDPEIAEVNKQLEPLFAAIPRLIVDKEGSFRELEGTNSLLNRMRLVMPLRDVEGLRAALSNPQARQMFEEAVALRWRAWVELWLHFDPSKGQHQKPWSGFDPADAGDALSVLGVAPGRVSFSVVRRLGGVNAIQKTQALLRAFGAEPLSAEADSADIASELTIEVDSEWPDLKPLTAYTRKDVRVSVQGKELRQMEEHSYWFDWEASLGATPACTPRE